MIRDHVSSVSLNSFYCYSTGGGLCACCFFICRFPHRRREIFVSSNHSVGPRVNGMWVVLWGSSEQGSVLLPAWWCPVPDTGTCNCACPSLQRAGPVQVAWPHCPEGHVPQHVPEKIFVLSPSQLAAWLEQRRAGTARL